MNVRIGLLSISDRASKGEYEDRGTPTLVDYLAQKIISPYEIVAKLIADEQSLISSTLIEMTDKNGCSLILTTGGTGPAPRDVTPEATEDVCERILPGFGEVMRRVSYDIVPTAILSRQIAGTRGSCLIINLPGKPTAIAECLDAVMGAIPDCVDLIGGGHIDLHPSVRTYRPPQS